MFCRQCGQQLSENANFCSRCGASSSPMAFSPSELYRPRGRRMIAGVCAAFALHNHWDLAATRIVAVLIAVFLFPLGEVAYLAAWLLIPQQPAFAAAPGETANPDLQPR